MGHCMARCVGRRRVRGAVRGRRSAPTVIDGRAPSASSRASRGGAIARTPSALRAPTECTDRGARIRNRGRIHTATLATVIWNKSEAPEVIRLLLVLHATPRRLRCPVGHNDNRSLDLVSGRATDHTTVSKSQRSRIRIGRSQDGWGATLYTVNFLHTYLPYSLFVGTASPVGCVQLCSIVSMRCYLSTGVMGSIPENKPVAPTCLVLGLPYRTHTTRPCTQP